METFSVILVFFSEQKSIGEVFVTVYDSQTITLIYKVPKKNNWREIQTTRRRKSMAQRNGIIFKPNILKYLERKLKTIQILPRLILSKSQVHFIELDGCLSKKELKHSE